MNHRRRVQVLAIAALAAMAMPFLASADISTARQQALRHLLFQDCGSCHGITLKGGLGPALTREALADKPVAMLRDVILNGRPGTPMPPWKPFMNEDEATWLAQQLQRGITNDNN